MAETDSMIVTRDDGMVRWLTFNRPEKRNALSLDMLERALEEVRRFGADAASRVLILTGGGDRAFVSGADISEFGRGSGAERRYLDLGARLFHEIHRLPKPTIAMIRGYCFGGGVALATACDLRYASDDALFCIPAAKLGIAYDVDLAKRLLDLAGPAAAKEMLFAGRRYDAAQAERMGLVNRICAGDGLARETAGLAAEIARNAPLSVRSAKFAIAHLLAEPSGRDRSECERMVAACAESEDFAEGRAAFAEKRKPAFRGR